MRGNNVYVRSGFHQNYYPVTKLNRGDEVTIPAGTVVQITGVNRLNLATREAVIDNAGAVVPFTATRSADASLTSGAGNFVALVFNGTQWVTMGYKGTLAVGA